jgi:hypothetical protein
MAQQDIEQMREHIATLEEELRAARRDTKALTAELGELRPLKADAVFREAGFDPSTREGKLLRGLLGDTPPTVDAIREKAEAYEILPPQPGEGAAAPAPERSADAQALTDATQRIDDLRQVATPVGGVRMTHDEFRALQRSNPAASVEALKAGQVDLNPEVAAAVAANRAERNHTFAGS